MRRAKLKKIPIVATRRSSRIPAESTMESTNGTNVQTIDRERITAVTATARKRLKMTRALAMTVTKTKTSQRRANFQASNKQAPVN